MHNFKVTVELEAHDPSAEFEDEYGVGPFHEVVYLSAASEQEASNKAMADRLDFYTKRDDIPYAASVVAVHRQVG